MLDVSFLFTNDRISFLKVIIEKLDGDLFTNFNDLIITWLNDLGVLELLIEKP